MNDIKKQLIVIEGLDGSGKATQTQMLYDYICSRGIKAKKLSFPDYDSESSALVKMYLRGDFGGNVGDVNAYATTSFYAIDRYASYNMKWSGEYNSGTVIVSDRYCTANLVHQMAKLPESEWEFFLNWHSDYEYDKLGIPRPSIVLFLDMSPEATNKLLLERYSGDEYKKDIHEKDLEYTKLSRKAACFAMERQGWVRIECSNGDNPRPIEDIKNEIITQIRKVVIK